MEQQTKEQRAQALRRQIGTALGKLDAQEIGAVRALAQLDALEKWQLHELLRFIEWLAAKGTGRAA